MWYFKREIDNSVDIKYLKKVKLRDPVSLVTESKSVKKNSKEARNSVQGCKTTYHFIFK